jgi:integrase
MQLGNLRRLANLFQRCGRKSWKDLRAEDFRSARERFASRNKSMGATIGQLRRFLEQVHGMVLAPKPATRVESELIRYTDYLRQVRGFACQTIAGNRSCVGAFLRFIGYERSRSAIAAVGLLQIEAFLRSQAKTCSRDSVRYIVWCLRGYLRFHHTAGTIRRPLHTLVDAPRVYRLERLPKALPWPQVQALLRSIDRSELHGRRDYTLLFMMATYGLRRSEVVSLTLDDIDWRNGILRVRQRKTRQHLTLPLTDEAGDCLQHYLRNGRPPTAQRALFLRLLPPVAPLTPGAVNEILDHRVRRSGLDFPSRRTHCFRHSLATRLLREGVALKTIGDTLGHRAVESTAAYLRLGIDDLRGVGLEVPSFTAASVLLGSDWQSRMPPVQRKVRQRAPNRFRSGMGASIKRYLATKRALGRKYIVEAISLRHWDAFLYRHQGNAETFDRELFQLWTASLSGLAPLLQRHQMQHVRNFLLFHARDHTGSFIPDSTAFPKISSKHTPRLVSAPEMARLLATASGLPPSRQNPLRAETFRIALILLFCCGLRRGELLRLRLAHIDPQQCLLRIENTKFHKSRLVPLPISVAGELRDYLNLCREKHLPMEPNRYLIWNRQCSEGPTRRVCTAFNRTWWRLCLSAGVVDQLGRPPRIHDLRHSTAVAALERWYTQGQDVQSKLQQLATYLGHLNPACTHYYLHLTPKLREAASQRFHQRSAPLFKKGARV